MTVTPTAERMQKKKESTLDRKERLLTLLTLWTENTGLGLTHKSWCSDHCGGENEGLQQRQHAQEKKC